MIRLCFQTHNSHSKGLLIIGQQISTSHFNNIYLYKKLNSFIFFTKLPPLLPTININKINQQIELNFQIHQKNTTISS